MQQCNDRIMYAREVGRWMAPCSKSIAVNPHSSISATMPSQLLLQSIPHSSSVCSLPPPLSTQSYGTSTISNKIVTQRTFLESSLTIFKLEPCPCSRIGAQWWLELILKFIVIMFIFVDSCQITWDMFCR
jgi:hypothetical protein